MTSLPQGLPLNTFISPQNQILSEQEIQKSIPISQQIYPPTQPQAQLPENIDPSKYISSHYF